MTARSTGIIDPNKPVQNAFIESFNGRFDVFDTKGLPLSLYTDRGTHYFVTLKAGETVDAVG